MNATRWFWLLVGLALLASALKSYWLRLRDWLLAPPPPPPDPLVLRMQEMCGRAILPHIQTWNQTEDLAARLGLMEPTHYAGFAV